ncbi:hypothetical protein NG821_11710 [Prevotella cerevisiae]|uniref:Uncharacterized protein n=1 Tax=Segatella cerevisiae TaxID=2053716 RepID=A0ABT1C188_9BACT|nr:hypothetical protein [Segatella cerevisiae]MCO6026492.1 hypothetical protein [Segatella cerevisiae]
MFGGEAVLVPVPPFPVEGESLFGQVRPECLPEVMPPQSPVIVDVSDTVRLLEIRRAGGGVDAPVFKSRIVCPGTGAEGNPHYQEKPVGESQGQMSVPTGSSMFVFRIRW